LTSLSQIEIAPLAGGAAVLTVLSSSFVGMLEAPRQSLVSVTLCRELPQYAINILRLQ
jgi:hypothetical protein